MNQSHLIYQEYIDQSNGVLTRILNNVLLFKMCWSNKKSIAETSYLSSKFPLRRNAPGCPQRLEKLEKGLFYKFWLEKLENMYLLQQQRLEKLENVFFNLGRKVFHLFLITMYLTTSCYFFFITGIIFVFTKSGTMYLIFSSSPFSCFLAHLV